MFSLVFRSNGELFEVFHGTRIRPAGQGPDHSQLYPVIFRFQVSPQHIQVLAIADHADNIDQ